jgi:ABC-type multidrug transport system fused ATPase/permease subunit
VSTTGPRSREITRVYGLLGSEADARIRLLGLATVALVIGNGLLAALTPLVLKSLIDAVAASNQAKSAGMLPSTWKFGATYLLLLVGGPLLTDLRPLLSGTINQRLHKRLTSRFFNHVSCLPMGFLVKCRTGELVHRLDLASAGAQMLVSHLVTSVVPVFVELVTMTVVLIHLGQPALVGVFGAAALAYLAIFSTGARRMMRASRGVSEASLETHARLGDSVAHIDTLRYFAAERQARRRLDDASAVLESRWLTLNRLNGLIATGASIIFASSMAACLYIGATAVQQHLITLGGFVLTTVYMLQMVQPLESLGSAARDLARAIGCLNPLLDLLAEPVARDAILSTDITPRNGSMRSKPPSVHVQNLHFAYDPFRPVLLGVDFDVPGGSMTAIVGRSGSGKSSLARLLMRLYAPQRGSIRIDGRDIESIDVGELRTSVIGLVPQETILLHDTVAGNIALGSPVSTREEILRAARAAQLEWLIDALPHGLDTTVGERGMQLSGGERQRIGIARALLRRPGLYVLDEPTSMLDSKTERDILNALRSLAEGATMIVIAHRLSTIVDADQILVLDEGQVRERGCHEALIARDGLYAQMWRQQVAGAT